MKIKQLIQKLEKLNPEAEVLIASDSEGNCYNVFSSICSDVKYRKQDYEIEILDKECIGDFVSQKEFDKAKEAVILFP